MNTTEFLNNYRQYSFYGKLVLWAGCAIAFLICHAIVFRIAQNTRILRFITGENWSMALNNLGPRLYYLFDLVFCAIYIVPTIFIAAMRYPNAQWNFFYFAPYILGATIILNIALYFILRLMMNFNPGSAIENIRSVYTKDYIRITASDVFYIQIILALITIFPIYWWAIIGFLVIYSIINYFFRFATAT